LEAFDQKRKDHQKAEGANVSSDNGSGSNAADNNREEALAQMKMASMSVSSNVPERRGLEGIIEVEVCSISRLIVYHT